ncbi:MAG TPA: hypothetical protein VNX21_04540 [Candidatus Thermoplasmatota archaeon]|nr:hypothetical protein [Candidatus Thermoplasmatota archaeon]
MGCTSEAVLSVSGGLLLREERTYLRGALATETRTVTPLLREP